MGFLVFNLVVQSLVVTICESMGLFFTKNEDEIVAVLDINSGSVGGAILLKNKKTHPLIIATSRRNFKFTASPDGARLEREMLESLDLVCQDLQKKTSKRPDKIYCVLSTPWSHGELRAIHHEKSKEFRFTEVFAEEMVKSEIQKFRSENSNLRQIVDRRITRVSLNGYPVDKPHGQSARMVTLDVFLSLSSKSVIDAVQDRVHKTWKSHIAFTSQIFSDFVFVRDIFDAKNDFIVINIGAEMTEVMVIKNDHLEGTAFFPYGSRNIIRAVALQLNRSVYESMSLFSLYSEELLSPDGGTFITEAMENSAELWRSELKRLLGEISSNRHLPKNIFLIAPESMTNWFSSMFTTRFFPEFTTSGREFSVIIPNREILYNFCQYSEIVEQDDALSRKSIFINRV